MSLSFKDQIFQMLSSLDVQKANGQAARMLKSTARSIAYRITLLFNNSIYNYRANTQSLESVLGIPCS